METLKNINFTNNEYIKNEFLKCLYNDILILNSKGGYIETKNENDIFLNELKNKIIVEMV